MIINGKKYTLNRRRVVENLKGIALFLIIELVGIIAILNAPQSPIEKYHQALDNGMSWNEYINTSNK